jgi:hypothetical protein
MRTKLADSAIWRDALRDILLVKPVPRLLLTFETMDQDKLIQVVTRLAAQDHVLTRHSDRPCRISHSIPLPGMRYAQRSWHKPTPLPGGEYFVLSSESKRALRVYSVLARSLDESIPLIPEQEYPIHVWKVVAKTSGELCVAIVTHETLSM